MRWIFVGVVAFLQCQASFGALNVPEQLLNDGTIGESGVKARLSRKGINYVATVLVQDLMPAILNAHIDKSTSNVEIGDDQISMTEVSMQSTSRPTNVDTDIEAPNLVLVAIPDLSITSTVQLSGLLDSSVISTLVALKVEKTHVDLSVEVHRTSVGAPNLRIHSCAIKVLGASSVSLESEGVDEAQKDLILSTLKANATQLLDEFVCRRIHYIVEVRVNERFALLTTKIPLSHIADDEIVRTLAEKLRERRQRRRRAPGPYDWGSMGAGIGLPFGGGIGAGLGRRRRRDTMIAGFDVSRADTLTLDYTITEETRVTEYGLEINSSGEVSPHGRGGTPFGAANLSLPHALNEQFHLQMAISDFLPQSLMWHGHHTGLFHTRIDPTTPHFKGIMQTSCSLSSGVLFCLGDLFPTLRKLHPNRRLALSFNTVQSPIIRFRPPAAGGSSFSLLGRIVILVIDPDTRVETEVAEMGIEVNAQMKLRLSATLVRPRVTLERIKLTTLSPGILLQNELNEAVALSREILQRMVNDILKEGLPVPIHPIFKLVRPKVKMIDRGLLLQANFDLNEPLLHALTDSELDARL